MNELASEHLLQHFMGWRNTWPHYFPLTLAKLRGRPAHVNNRVCQNLEKILEVLYGGLAAPEHQIRYAKAHIELPAQSWARGCPHFVGRRRARSPGPRATVGLLAPRAPRSTPSAVPKRLVRQPPASVGFGRRGAPRTQRSGATLAQSRMVGSVRWQRG